jgi:hypothetical protein
MASDGTRLRRVSVQIAWLCLLGAGSAHAQSASIAVLGLSSEDGDDATAAAVTTALRNEAASTYTVASTRASLSQMTMAQDCEISEADCRSKVGTALGVQHVLYGELRRVRAGGHEVSLHMFASAGGDERAAGRMIPEGETEGSDLARHARALLRALEGLSEAPSADTGGSTKATVTADVRPLADTENAPAAPARDEEPSSGSNDWLGFTLLGVGGVAGGLLAYSWIQISDAADDPSYVEYREAIGTMNPRGVDDVCKEADAGRLYGTSSDVVVAARDACSKGQTFETLQFVFLGVALAAVGAGVYFLVDDEGPETSARAGTPAFVLRPTLAKERAALDLRVSF